MSKKIDGKVIIYIQTHCEICEIIKQNKETIRETLSKYFKRVIFVNIDLNTVEFLAYGFKAVPTVIFPGYRPFEAIDPQVLMDPDKIESIIDGDLLPPDVLHFKAINRSNKGLVDNPNLEKLLGR